MSILSNRLKSCRAFWLLLIVSLWDGPVVWGHVHVVETGSLQRHLQQFHSNDPHPFELGWHWHISLPDEGEPGVPHQSDQHRVHPAKLSTKSLHSELHRWLFGNHIFVPMTFVPMNIGTAVPCRADSQWVCWLSLCGSLQPLLCRWRC